MCGMFVAPHGDWVAQVIFEDASAAFFDGAKDLFKYLLARDRFLPERRDLEIAATFVTDYYELRPIAAGELSGVADTLLQGGVADEENVGQTVRVVVVGDVGLDVRRGAAGVARTLRGPV